MAGISKAERERRAAAAAAPASANTPAAPAQPAAAAAAPAGGEKPVKAKTVRMTRDEPAHAKGPTEADVHQEEVENWKLHGWREA